MNFTTKLKRFNACEDAVEWAEQFDTSHQAWDKCERADWMLWIAEKLSDKNGNRKEVILCACKCARTALKYLPKNENRPLKAIKTTEDWAIGKATLKEVRTAAAASAATSYVSAAAAAASYAAYAASAATSYVSDAVSDAADAAAYAAAYAAADDASYASERQKSLKKLANIVRKNLKPPM